MTSVVRTRGCFPGGAVVAIADPLKFLPSNSSMYGSFSSGIQEMVQSISMFAGVILQVFFLSKLFTS